MQATLLSHDAMFPQLKADIAAAGEYVGAELGSELQSVTLAFNDECSTLLGRASLSHAVWPVIFNKTLFSDLRTRYESSILLWEKFTSVSQDTRHWLETALDTTTSISSSLEPPAALVSQLEVRLVVNINEQTLAELLYLAQLSNTTGWPCQLFLSV